MSAKLSRTKNIKPAFEPVDEYSPEQPGLINVAGEVFVINLPDETQDDLSSQLMDDSIKGDIAFQALFLGGLSKEDGGPDKPFTQQEQTDLRRIFRAIFGPRQQIPPTVSQLKSLGRKIIGKRGVVMPSKPIVFRLPCSDADRALMVKALEIRRTKLIEQIQTYDKLGLADIHARYLRDHLRKLSTLIDEEIATAIKTRRDCRYTGILDPNVPKPLPLSDARMERLLAIFAYLLAQGVDPLAALSGRLPNPSTIIPMMAQADAPDIYQYEDAFVKEKPGKSPEYTRTILKIKKVLEGDAALERAVDATQMEGLIKDTEEKLFGPTADRTGTMEDRKRRIMDRLTKWDSDMKGYIAEIAGLNKQLGEKAAALTKCLAEKGNCDKELAALKSGADKVALEAKNKELTAQVDTLGKEKTALETKLSGLQAEFDKLKGIADTAALLRVEKDELAARLKDCEDAKAKEKATLDAAIAKLTGERDKALGDLATKQGELDTANAALAAARTEVATLTAAAETNRTALETAQRALATAQDNVERLEGELEVLGRQNVALQGQLEAAEAELARPRPGAVPPPVRDEAGEAARAELQRQLDEAMAEIRRLSDLPPPPAPPVEDEAAIAARAAELARRDDTIRGLQDTVRDLQGQLDRALANSEVISRARDAALGDAATLRTANGQLNARMRQILDSINDLLRGQGLNIISPENEPDRVQAKIQALQGRLDAAAAPPVPPVQDNRTILCLLNILYHLVKRSYIISGDQEGVNYRAAFQLIEQMAQPPRNAQLNQDVFRLFLLSLKTLSETDELTDNEEEFVRQRLSSLSIAVLQSDANAAIVYPLGKRLLKTFYPARNLPEEISYLSLPVIYVLALTKKVLLENQAIINAAGCVLPVGLMGAPPASAAVRPGGPSGPAATSSVSGGPSTSGSTGGPAATSGISGGPSTSGSSGGPAATSGPSGSNGSAAASSAAAEEGKEDDEENNTSVTGLPGGLSRTATEASNENEEERPSSAAATGPIGQVGLERPVGGRCGRTTTVNPGVGNDKVSLVTNETKKLFQFPFCLKPDTAWTDLSLKDLKAKARASLIAAFGPPGTPTFKEAIRPYQSISIQIDGNTGDVTFTRYAGRGGTRKNRKTKSNNTKTYKKSQ